LGSELFVREGRRVRLTEAGRILKEHADAVLDRAARLEQTMAELRDGEAGHLRLGAIEPTASLRLPEVLLRFCEERPNVDVTLEVGLTDAIVRRVAEGTLDLGVCSPPPAGLGLDFEPLFVEKLALLVSEGHPLAGKCAVGVADLAEHRLLLSERPCAYRESVERALIARGAAPRSGAGIGTIEMGSFGAIKRAVQGGLGAAVVPVAAVAPPPAGTLVRDVDGVDLGLSVGLVRPANGDGPPTRALGALLEALRHIRA
jgi:DNA-binding transcriptional LysR family regulator